jgi:hypothetical protein
MKKPKQPKVDVSSIASYMIAHEVVLSCFFETLAKTQPTIAIEAAKAMRDQSTLIDSAKYPDVDERVSMYVELLEHQAGRALQ